MKSELRLRPHLMLPGASVVEVWHDGVLWATITGADGVPGVQVITKHTLTTRLTGDDLLTIATVTVTRGT